MRPSRSDAVCSLPVINMWASLRYDRVAHRPSVFTEKRSKARYAIRDTTLPQCVPVDRGVDRDHWFVDPEFCDAGETSHSKVRPDLHDRFHCGIVDLDNGVPQLLFTHMRNLHGTATLQPLQRDDFEAAILEETPNLRIANRHIGRDHSDTPNVAIPRQRGPYRVGPGRHRCAPSHFLHTSNETLAPFETVPERLRGHSKNEAIGLARHHYARCVFHRGPNVIHQLVEIVIILDGIIRNV